MKALILGCGEMGEEALKDIFLHGDLREIAVATRNPEKANAVLSRLGPGKPRVRVERVDLDDALELKGLMGDADVVINCVGPNYKYELPVARAAIQAGKPLVDLNDEYLTTLQMYDLDESARAANVTIVMGLGASPGVNNILVRAAADELSEIESIRTAWVMSGADPGGLALSYHLLYSLSDKAFVVQDGQREEVRSFIDGRESIDFPMPVGRMDVFHIGHPEPITLSRCYPQVPYIDDKATFNPPSVNDMILALGKINRDSAGSVRVRGRDIDVMDFAAAYLNAHCKRMSGVPLPGALRVEVLGRKGKKRLKYVYSSAGRIAQGTGIPAAIGAEFILEGKITKKGILAPEECIDPHPFLHELLKRKIGKLNGWIEEVH